MGSSSAVGAGGVYVKGSYEALVQRGVPEYFDAVDKGECEEIQT